MRIFVAGQRGMLGQDLVTCLEASGFEVMSRDLPELDICQMGSIRRVFKEVQPDLLINVAAYTAVDKAESEPDAAFAVNRDGAAWLAEACHSARIPLIHLSTDYVFDGMAAHPYNENDLAASLGIYGQSKWEGEEAIRNCHQEHLIVRTAWLYGRHGTNFVKTMLRLAEERTEIRVVSDQYGSPTWTRDLAAAIATMCQRIIRDRHNTPWGTYHFCGGGETTWHGFAQAIIEEAKAIRNLPVEEVVPIPTAAYPTPARRPGYSALDCSKIQSAFGIVPSAWRESLHSCIQEFYQCPTLLPATS